MKTFIKCIVAAIMATVACGCCISSRSWKIDKEITGYRLPASGMYATYVSDEPVYVDVPTAVKDGDLSIAVLRKIKMNARVYKYCSYHNGPFAGSDIYPGTRMTLNALSGWSYSSAASGDYMMNVITIPLYPIVLCNLPVQFVLDTILLPYDLIAAPTCPDGYTLRE